MDSGLLLNSRSCSKIWFFAVSETKCFTGQSAFSQFFYHLFILQNVSGFLISLSVHLSLFNHIRPSYIFSFLFKEQCYLNHSRAHQLQLKSGARCGSYLRGNISDLESLQSK